MSHRPGEPPHLRSRELGTKWGGTTYDRRWEAYIEATLRLLMERLRDAPPPPDVWILDVGCGTGALLERIAREHVGARLAGVDPSSTMIAAAARRFRGAEVATPVLVEGSSAAMPFTPGSFGLAVCSSSLHFWPDPGAGLREIARVLGPGGRLVLLDWSGDRLPMRLLDYWLRFRDPRHQRVLGRAELGALVEQAGYRVHEIRQLRSHGLWSHLLLDAVVPGALPTSPLT